MSSELIYTKKDDPWYVPISRSGPVLGKFTLDIYSSLCLVQTGYRNGMETRVGHVEMGRLNVWALGACCASPRSLGVMLQS